MLRHMKEIAELQTQQKNEIEALYIRLGKPLPPNMGFLHSAPPSGRRRRTSKNKLKGGKLLNPLVQQLRSGTSSTSRCTRLLSTSLLVLAVMVLLCNCMDCIKVTDFFFFLKWRLKFAWFWSGLPLRPSCYSAPCWTVPSLHLLTVFGRQTISHFNLEYSLVTFSHLFSKCNLLMFVFTS